GYRRVRVEPGETPKGDRLHLIGQPSPILVDGDGDALRAELPESLVRGRELREQAGPGADEAAEQCREEHEHRGAEQERGKPRVTLARRRSLREENGSENDSDPDEQTPEAQADRHAVGAK